MGTGQNKRKIKQTERDRETGRDGCERGELTETRKWDTSIVLLVAQGGNMTLDGGEMSWECEAQREMYNYHTEKKEATVWSEGGLCFRSERTSDTQGLNQNVWSKESPWMPNQPLRASLQRTQQAWQRSEKQHNGEYSSVWTTITVQLHTRAMLFP